MELENVTEVSPELTSCLRDVLTACSGHDGNKDTLFKKRNMETG